MTATRDGEGQVSIAPRLQVSPLRDGRDGSREMGVSLTQLCLLDLVVLYAVLVNTAAFFEERSAVLGMETDAIFEYCADV